MHLILHSRIRMCVLRTVDLLNCTVGRRVVDGKECRVKLILDFCICTVIVAVSVVSRILELVAAAIGRVGTSWDSNSQVREIGRVMCVTPGLVKRTGLPGTCSGALSPGRKWPMREKTEMRIWRSGPATPPLKGRERPRHGLPQRWNAGNVRFELMKRSV